MELLQLLLVGCWLLGVGSSSAASDEPLSVGTVEHLFVDDAFTAEARGLALTMHPPAKTGQLLIAPDRPWERVLWWYTTILKVSETDYRLYYDADGPAGRFLCVALSPDVSTCTSRSAETAHTIASVSITLTSITLPPAGAGRQQLDET
eukprot:SAG31_NODE_62_length_28678_cov_21.548270_33_plen_149_part_00